MEDYSLIYPLEADDSQRVVVKRVASGESVNVYAGPGTGKSQTVINAVVNLLLRGRSVCVMSEKAAANEVFLEYAKRCGLDAYCLVIKDDTNVKDIIRQIKTLISCPKLFVDTEHANDIVSTYHRTVAEIGKLNTVYRMIPELGTNLYSIIGDAILYDDLNVKKFLHFAFKDYRRICQTLEELQTQVLSTLSDSDWKSFLEEGSTEDEEVDELLVEFIEKIENYGVEFRKIVNLSIPKDVVSDILKSQLARFTAESYIESYDLKGFGNVKVKTLYKQLLKSCEDMKALYRSFLYQELGTRIAKVAKDNRFIELLDRIASSKISLHDFFNKFGKEIMKLCPVLVGTPNMLVGYDKLNTFDTLIIDESSQVPITSILPFMKGNRQLVVFGDPQQLDLSIYFAKNGIYDTGMGDDFDLSETDKSILHVVQGKLPGLHLEYHYRSKTERLIAVSNEKCYDGLLHFVTDRYRTNQDLPEELGYKIIQVDKPEISSKGANLTEAETIVRETQRLHESYPEKSIGIITFNERQYSAIRDKFDEQCFNVNDEQVFIRTIDNCQGKEADIILISVGHCRKNNDGSINKQISELYKEGALNRLNVLFTRAREKIVVVMSFNYEELKYTDNKGLQRFYEYLHYAATGEYTKVVVSDFALQDRFNSVLTKKIAQCTDGCQSYGKIGHESMMIDVAVLKNGEGVYSKGILLPCKEFTSNTIYTKIKVLERAGWNLLPLSPVSFFTKVDTFEKQVRKDIQENAKYSCEESPLILKDVRSAVPFTLNDFKPKFGNPLKIETLLSENLDKAYAPVWSKEVARASTKGLQVLAKQGNKLATLRFTLFVLSEYIKQGKFDRLLAVARRYISMKEPNESDIEEMLTYLDSLFQYPDVSRTSMEARRHFEKIDSLENSLRKISILYGTTLNIVLEMETFIFCAGIGDGDIIAVTKKNVDWLLPPSEQFSTRTNSLCLKPERAYEVFRSVILRKTKGKRKSKLFETKINPDYIIVSSDGLRNSFVNDEYFISKLIEINEERTSDFKSFRDNSQAWIEQLTKDSLYQDDISFDFLYKKQNTKQ